MSLDLFGNPLDPPKRVAMPLFDPPPVIAVPLEPPAATPAGPRPRPRPRRGPKGDSGTLAAKPRPSLKDEVEAELRRLCIPYVAVDEAKKALFADARLKAFHFVVYSRRGSNWLLWCGEPDKATRADMDQWGQVFGEGFCVVYALRRAAGIVYRTAGGRATSLHDCLSDAAAAAAATPQAKEQA